MSENPSVGETVKKIVTRIVRKSEEEYSPNATFQDMKADSLDIVQILVAIEDTYDIEIPDESLEGVTDMGSFIKCIEGIIAEKG